MCDKTSAIRSGHATHGVFADSRRRIRGKVDPAPGVRRIVR
jgi:hypothetical protein